MKREIFRLHLQGKCRHLVMLLLLLMSALQTIAVPTVFAAQVQQRAAKGWSVANLSQSRSDITATVVGDLAIFAGGNSSKGYSNVVDMYNAEAGQWSTAALSQARNSLVATAVNGSAIFAGGFNSWFSNVVDIYNVSKGQWSTGALSQGREDLVATTVGNLAIFAGGTGPAWASNSNIVDIYNSGTGQWSAAALSQGRFGLAATTVGNDAIFAGGEVNNPSGGYTYSAVVDIYNSSTGQWSTSKLSQARGGLAATTVGDEAIFAGGGSGTGSPSDVVDIYNSSTGQWSTSKLSQARSSLAAITVGDEAIFAGGWSGTGSPSDVVDIYNSSTGQWSTSKLSQARGNLAATTFGDEAVFAGGWSGTGSSSNVVDIYNSSTGQWSTSKLSQARGNLAATTVGDEAFFAGGQSSPYGGQTNIVDIYHFGVNSTPQIMNVTAQPVQLYIIMLMVWGLFWLVSLAVPILICWLTYKCLASIPNEFRRQEPAMAWLLLIPLFNIVWMFFVFLPLARGYQAYFQSRGRTDVGDCGYKLSHSMCVWTALSLIPLVGWFLFVWVAFVLWIIALVKAWHFKRLIEQDMAVAATPPPPPVRHMPPPPYSRSVAVPPPPPPPPRSPRAASQPPPLPRRDGP